MNKCFTCEIINTFENDQINENDWNTLLSNSEVEKIYMSWRWQKTWWESWGRGNLLILIAKQENKTITILPLFEDGKMLFIVGSGWSDNLDVIGNNNPDIICELLNLAVNTISDLLGMRFYHIPQTSKTSKNLHIFSKNFNWQLYKESELISPLLELKTNPETLIRITQQPRILQEERWFERNGGFEIIHLDDEKSIILYLEEFFDQDIKRRENTDSPSPFIKESQRNFFASLCKSLNSTGWLRFSFMKWKEEYLAFHFGFNYKGTFVYWKPCYNRFIAQHSPGKILLRHLILKAQQENCHHFDFGLGDEQYKKKFCTTNHVAETWGLYPRRTATTL